jgi:hypothetical protein
MTLIFILSTISLFFGPKKKAMGDHQLRKEQKRKEELAKKVLSAFAPTDKQPVGKLKEGSKWGKLTKLKEEGK